MAKNAAPTIKRVKKLQGPKGLAVKKGKKPTADETLLGGTVAKGGKKKRGKVKWEK